jgi:predicted glycosyltransferase
MSSLRILMYSNNSRGLGNTARTLHIAASLSKALENCSILVLTDLPTVGRFRLEERVDYVHLPILDVADAAPRGADIQGRSQSGLNIELDSKLRMRRKIAQSAMKTFRPDVVMLDESLFDHPLEMQRITAYVADELPQAKVVWEFSDIWGAPEWVTQHWTKNGVAEVLEGFGDEIFVFGARHLFNLAENYRLPERIARKLVYTGYLARQAAPLHRVPKSFVKLHRILPLVMLCPGDSAGDFAMIDVYLRFLEKKAADLAVQSFIFASPAMRSYEKHALALRARKLPNVEFHRFGKNTLQYAKFADLVICDGEYNLTRELLSHKKMALMVPHALQQPDNFARAHLFQKRGLVRVVQAEAYHPMALREMITELLFSGPRLVQKNRYKEIPFDGFANIAERIRSLVGLAAPAVSPPLEYRIAS